MFRWRRQVRRWRKNDECIVMLVAWRVLFRWNWTFAWDGVVYVVVLESASHLSLFGYIACAVLCLV